MGKESLKNILIVFLLSAAFFSGFKYISTIRENYVLSQDLNKAKEQAAALEKERQGLAKEKQNILETLEKEKVSRQELTRENFELKDIMIAANARMTKLFVEAKKKQDYIEQLNSRLSSLTVENGQLRGQSDQLRTELNKVSREIENVKAGLNSLTEPKAETGKSKRQMRNLTKETEPKADDKKNNHGFLMQGNKAASTGKAKIEVVPLTSGAPEDKNTVTPPSTKDNI